MKKIDPRKVRLAKGMTQQEVADYLGVGVTDVSRLERGERALTRWQVFAYRVLLAATYVYAPGKNRNR